MGWWEDRQRRRKHGWELYKFQRPLNLICADPRILIYNSLGTTLTAPYDNPQEWDEIFRGQPKVYAWGRVEQGQFVFNEDKEIIRDPREFPEW